MKNVLLKSVALSAIVQGPAAAIDLDSYLTWSSGPHTTDQDVQDNYHAPHASLGTPAPTPLGTPAGAPYWKACSHVKCDMAQQHHIAVEHHHLEQFGT